jgi:hypothetical protein
MDLKIRSERISGVEGKRFREGGKLFRNVRIFLEGSDSDLDKIDSVQYELHPTFRERYQVSSNRRKNFELRIWTYGYFGIKAKLIMKDNSIQIVQGFVKW